MTIQSRFALRFSDGSFSVLSPDKTLAEAERECGMEDPKERDPAKRPALVRVDLQVTEEFVFAPRRRTTPISRQGASLLDAAKSLSCDDQYAIAEAVAANVGYILRVEPQIDK